MKQLLGERGWIFAAGICLLCAALFLALAQLNAAFVAAALGVVSWFLNIRNHLKRRIIPADDEFDDESDEIEDVDES